MGGGGRLGRRAGIVAGICVMLGATGCGVLTDVTFDHGCMPGVGQQLDGDSEEPCATPIPMGPVSLAVHEAGFVPDRQHEAICRAFEIVQREIQPAFQEFEDEEFLSDREAVADAGGRIYEAGEAIETLPDDATDPEIAAVTQELGQAFQAEGRRAAEGDLSDRSARELFKGVMREYENECLGLRPDQRMTRAQVAMRFVEVLDLPPAADDFFADDDGSGAEDALNRMAAVGILTGCGDRAVCPEELVTRGELAAYIARALRLPETDEDFFDDDDGSRFESSINRIAAIGLVEGYRQEGFSPDTLVSDRDLNRFLSRARNR
jgi:hypothetical protein